MIFARGTSNLAAEDLQITMMTGQTPDINYDYELDKKIPSLPDTLDSGAKNQYFLCFIYHLR